MHLLTETAMVDSKDYEILSFEEVEKLKKERTLLRNRVDATRRRLALETKLKDAAQSLNRLYSTKGSPGSGGASSEDPSKSPRRQRRSLLGSRGANNEALNRADDEYAASCRRIEELTQELARLERRLEETQKRILEHTAGILQMTHKGLKKNLRKQELPRSPESMISDSTRNAQTLDAIDDFDERSLYRIPDYVSDFGLSSSMNPRRPVADNSLLESTEQRLLDLSRRIHGLILQADPEEHLDPPSVNEPGSVKQPAAQIQARLGYLAVGLDAMEAAQAKTIAQAQKSMFDSEDHLEGVNVRLQEILEKTNLVGENSVAIPANNRGKSMQSQLTFSTMVLDRLNERIDSLLEQKDILTRQIQQQRELNSKSDNQRDGQIQKLNQALEEAKRAQLLGEKESQGLRDQANVLIEQLELAKQENSLLQKQQNMQQDKALQAEKDDRRKTEESLLSDLRAVQQQHGQLQAAYNQLKGDFELASQKHSQQLDDLSTSKEQTQIDLEKHRTMNEELQLHLSKTRAELDTHRQKHLEQQEELSKAKVAFEAETAVTRNIVERLSQEKSTREAELEKAQAELKTLESEVVRSQTELTMVKAELDAAYGTRAQRAADVSMNPAVQKEIDDLNSRNADLEKQLENLHVQRTEKGAAHGELENQVNALQRELKETIEDYELMTKASIEFEKERDQLEATIDSLREKCEGLEAQLSDEKVKWLGAKSNAPTDTTSTMVLKNEFKKMMRDTRAENTKALRVSFLTV